MNQGGRHRRVYSLEWLEAPFQSLSDGERVVYFYAKTGPQSTSVGIYRLSSAVAVEEIGNITTEEFIRRLDVVCRACGWAFDPIVRVLWMPRWIDDNPPQSPNVVASWRKLLNNVPDCQVKADAVESIHRYLKDKEKAFREPFGSYRVSLPEDFSQPKPQSQSQAQAQAEAYQGSGSRGSGNSGNSEQALRGKTAHKGKATSGNGHQGEASSQLVPIARETLTHTSPDGEIETLIDTFHWVATLRGNKQTHETFKRNEVIQALNAAISERRQTTG